MAEPITLDIVRLGARGDGVADTPAGPVYVAGTLPGERVLATVTGDRGRLVTIERASADRVAAPCPHFGVCGGCVAQHIGAVPYHAWKRDMVLAAFGHRGLSPVVDAIVAVPPGTRRRATFAAERKRDGAITLGLKADSKIGDDWSVDAKLEAYPQRADWHLGGQGTDNGRHCPDRQINMARHDHQKHPQRHDDDVRVLQEQVGDVLRAEERHADE